MVTNSTYLSYIKQIANLFCQDAICKASLEIRLKEYFDNTTFGIFLQHLNSKRFYHGFFYLPMVKVPGKDLYTTRFSYTDILTGQSGVSTVQLPGTIYNPNNTDWKKVIEYVNAPYLTFVNIIGDKIIFYSSELGGYGIAFVPNQPAGGTTTGGTTTAGTTSGQIQVPQPTQTQMPVQTQMPTQKSLDLNSFIVPGLIVLGVLVAKKYKMF